MTRSPIRPDRKKLHDELLKDLKGFSKDYVKRARKAASAIYRRLCRNKRGSISDIVADVLKKEGFRDATAESLHETLVRAVAHGYGILPKMVSKIDAAREALTFDAWESSGFTLSQKLYRDHLHTLSCVTSAIQTSMKRGDALQALSRRLYDGYGHESIIPQAELPKYLAELDREARRVLTGGDLRDFQKAYRKARANVGSLKEGAPLKSAYREMLGAAQSGSEKHLERAVRVALEEKSRYHAERIARTEAARAYYEGFRARNDRDDDVVAYRWELSSAHGGTQHCDCEEHAERDGYGLGAGVYPKNECPNLPAHPHCMCHLVEVYAGELPKEKERELVGGGDEERANAESGKAEETEKTGSLSEEELIAMAQRIEELSEDEKIVLLSNLANRNGQPYNEANKHGDYVYYDDDGRPIYPPNDGAKGRQERKTLYPGDSLIDRYGKDNGFFLSPEGTPIGKRSLPTLSRSGEYHKYIVRGDLSVMMSEILPWFGQPGGGIQYKTDVPIRELIGTSLEEVSL